MTADAALAAFWFLVIAGAVGLAAAALGIVAIVALEACGDDDDD